MYFNLGSVDGTKGDWIGIDWDDPSRGKHDGSHKGNNYFSTKTETSGSFVRITKVSKGRTHECCQYTNLEQTKISQSHKSLRVG